MALTALPAFKDNYIWLLDNGTSAVVIDPGDAEPVLYHLSQHRLELTDILVTHHHRDHTNGVDPLQTVTGAQVHWPKRECLLQHGRRVGAGDWVHTLGLKWQVLDVPGHTLGHVAYVCPASEHTPHPLLFCGDVLFSAGCGRLMEGTALQMQASLTQLAQLPKNTLICCAHEYTLSNLRFAQHVEPTNRDIEQHLLNVTHLREQDLPSLPTTLGLELKINPFLRTHLPSVRQAIAQWAEQHSPPTKVDHPHEWLQLLRTWKNIF